MNTSTKLSTYGLATETSGTQTTTEHLAIRVTADNENHHLWNNNGTWWCHFTVHRPDYTKRRVRLSLGTRDLDQARRIRDLFLAGFGDTTGALNN